MWLMFCLIFLAYTVAVPDEDEVIEVWQSLMHDLAVNVFSKVTKALWRLIVWVCVWGGGVVLVVGANLAPTEWSLVDFVVFDGLE